MMLKVERNTVRLWIRKADGDAEDKKRTVHQTRKQRLND